MGCCVDSGRGNHFLEHWRTKLQMLVKYAVRHVKHIKLNVCVGVSYQSCCHCMPRACRQTIEGDAQDARRQSAGVRRSFFANNSSASPAENVLGLVPLTGGRRAILPSMHGRSFTAPLTREALRAERRAAAERAAQGVLRVAFSSFLDQLPPRLPPRPSTNPTFTSFLTQTPILLTKELLQLPDAPSLFAQRCKYMAWIF